MCEHMSVCVRDLRSQHGLTVPLTSNCYRLCDEQGAPTEDKSSEAGCKAAVVTV